MLTLAVKFDIRPTILLSSSRVDQEERSTEINRHARPESLVGDGTYVEYLQVR